MPKRTQLPVLSAEQHQALLDGYNQAADPETRTRYQMLLLGVEHGWTTHQIAPLVKRSHDGVLRVFHRFLTDGLAAVPRRSPPGREPTVTPSAEAELLRVIEDDPHQHGVASANWTTILLADYLAQTIGIRVDPETVRRHLHQVGYVCKRSTWTVAHKAAEREDWEGNACG
ncbi:MAG TPA: helix-turn-helix domain-containing protein [Gemmatimonadales bacterium]|nr:helix-turn-helix domain-containing protein [Gemmatimonadales bacterium]